MDQFKEYLRFPDWEKAYEFMSLLEKNRIPFQVDDSGMRFNAYVPNTPWESQIILKVRDEDIENVTKLFDTEMGKKVKDISLDQYLYKFEDKNTPGTIENQNKWDDTDVNLDRKIPTEQKINSDFASAKKVVDIMEAERIHLNAIQEPLLKPKKLSIAIFLLALVFVESVIYRIAKGFLDSATNISPANHTNSHQEPMQLIILLLELILVLGGPILLLYKINLGKNWARTTYSFVTALSAAYFLFYLRYFMEHNFTTGIISGIETILQIIALKFLYDKEVNRWFDFKSIKSPVEIVKD